MPGTEDRSLAHWTVKPSKNHEDREISCWGYNEMGSQAMPCDIPIKVASKFSRVLDYFSFSLGVGCHKILFISYFPEIYKRIISSANSLKIFCSAIKTL